MTGPSQPPGRKTTPAFPPGQSGMRAAFNPRQPAEYGSDKAAVQAAFEQLGGAKRVMALLGLGKTETYELADERRPDEVATYVQARALTAAGATAFAEDLAFLAGGAFIPMPEAEGALAGLTADLLRQHGETCAQLMQALVDGKVDRAEALRNLPNVHALMADLAAVYAVLLQIAAPASRPEA